MTGVTSGSRAEKGGKDEGVLTPEAFRKDRKIGRFPCAPNQLRQFQRVRKFIASIRK